MSVGDGGIDQKTFQTLAVAVEKMDAKLAEKCGKSCARRLKRGSIPAYGDWLAGQDLDDPGALGEATKAWVAERGQKIPELFQPLRCALTGLPGGPDLFEVMALLGREAVMARLAAGVGRLGEPVKE